MSLVLSAVGHRYRDRPPVLTDVNLVVGPEETLAITGPSGSGKTTLLSIIGGLLHPTSGHVTLDGTRIDRRQAAAGVFGWVFQSINLFPRRTAGENVAVGLFSTAYTPGAAKEPSRRMLEAVGLADLVDEPAIKLSGGEAQRVGVARALVGRPRYVLADEPTGQLDRSTSDLVAEALMSALPPGTTLITATHDMRLAERCHRRLELLNGRLREVR